MKKEAQAEVQEKKPGLLEVAKNNSHRNSYRGRDAGAVRVTDKDTFDLVNAYIKGDISNRGIATALKEVGYKVANEGTAINYLASRFIRLLRQGAISIQWNGNDERT